MLEFAGAAPASVFAPMDVTLPALRDGDRHSRAGIRDVRRPHRDRSHGGAAMTKTRLSGNLADRPMASLTRKRQPMPAFVREALNARGRAAKYRARPAYQRNDYLMWINTAKSQATKQRRLRQMLSELDRGGVYMKMKWKG
jgi:hypothetical protein